MGGSGKLMTVINAVAPRLTDAYMETAMFEAQRRNEPERGPDALYAPADDGRRRGPTGRRTVERSAYTRAALSDVTRVLPVIAVGALVAAGVRAMRKAG